MSNDFHTGLAFGLYIWDKNPEWFHYASKNEIIYLGSKKQNGNTKNVSFSINTKFEQNI